MNSLISRCKIDDTLHAHDDNHGCVSSPTSTISLTTVTPIPCLPPTHPLILTRLYCRWHPFLAKEPTSTLVLITPQNQFLDLRFCRNSITPRLVGGTAGTYIRTSTSGMRAYTLDALDPHPQNHLHSLRCQANGDIYETGVLPNPGSGTEDLTYEAVWRVSPVQPRLAVVLAYRGTHGQGVVVRVGSWCQGLLVKGKLITAERWQKLDGRWVRVMRLGNAWLPCGVACVDRDEAADKALWQGARYWREATGLKFVVEKVIGFGDRVVAGGDEWEVVERVQW